MEIAGAAAGETTKSAITHLERELGYLVHFKKNVNNLKNKMQQLSAATNDLQSLISGARNNNELIQDTVQAWLRRAEIVDGEATQLIDEAEHINSWFKGWCCSRFSLGRKAEKKNAVIQGLLDERSTIGNNVSIPKPSQSLPLVSAGDFNAFSSRESTAKQVIKALRDEKMNLVGVFGMAGVGKTMLIQAIAKQVKDEKIFQEVVVVTVSQNHILDRIQGEIAKGLDLKFGDEDASFTRAARLSERLNQGKTILIVLDDVWERLDLAKAGICLKSQNKSCKIVFTTRERSVCNQMEADESVEVAVLPEDDSWILFRQKAGEVVDSTISPRISREIVKECKGLPLAIVTLGLTLRNNGDESTWNYTLTQLKKSIYDDDLSPVVSSIRLSYDFLQNETIRLCFLFCCLFPEDSKISTEDLLWYLIGENLIKNVDNLEEARGKLQSFVGKLTSSNLLLKDKDGDTMMHDVVRDVAISIASEDDRRGFIVKAGLGLTRWPNLDFSNGKRMSVMKNKIIRYDLPHPIKAPHLVTLSMRDNESLKEIPDDFFNDMGSLLTLDLSSTGITSLPSSLSCLLNLCTLLIEYCRLDCISPTEKLERLEILSFGASSVERNPHSDAIVNWSSVKLLCPWKRGFPSKALAGMFSLEELYIDTTEFALDILYHIPSLTRLDALWFHGNDPDILFRDIPGSGFENLTGFRLYFCREIPIVNVSSHFKRIMVLEISSNVVVANWVKLLVAKTEALILRPCPCEGIESVLELDATGLNDLKVLHFDVSNTVKYLINTVAERTSKFVFRSLEELHMDDLPIFESFCIGSLPDGFLCKLRVLKVRKCNGVISLIQADLLLRLQNLEKLKVRKCARLEKLIEFEEREDQTSTISNYPQSPAFPNLQSVKIKKCPLLEYVFSLTVARGLLQLIELTVDDCANMKMIFADGTGEDTSNAEKDKLIFPRLKNIFVSSLRKLSTLSPPGVIIDCPSLEKLKVHYCENLKRLPFGSECIPKLQRLEADLDWFNELEWDDEHAKSRMRESLSLIQKDEDTYSEASLDEDEDTDSENCLEEHEDSDS